tara:strand:- start:26 stop:238 length:213 start_codon:yes stop_codon:yes gene_type:complete
MAKLDRRVLLNVFGTPKIFNEFTLDGSSHDPLTWEDIDHALRAGRVPGVEPMTLEEFLAIHGYTDKKEED